jgi:hypothetical protein
VGTASLTSHRSVASKKTDRDTGSAIEYELRQHLPEDARKLESMSRETSGKNHLWVTWVAVDDEVFVWAHRVQADNVLLQIVRDTWQILTQETFDALLVLWVDFTVDQEWVGDWLSTRVLSDFEAEAIDLRVPVENPRRGVMQKNGIAVCGRIGRVVDCIPKQRFAAHLKTDAEVTE